MFPQNRKEWIEKLISYDTTSRNSNLPIVKFMESYLNSLGVKTTLTYDSSKTKANLFACFQPASGSSKGGLIFSGHLDTVPVDGQKWATDPFKAVEIDGKIYGRGTCDMKGFIALCMSLSPKLKEMAKYKPIYFAWTYDEEVGCFGGRVLTDYIKKSGIVADGCIVGEPSNNQIVTTHKGIHVWRVTVKGKDCHSSRALTEHGCNAIDYAARLVVKIREIAEELSVGDKDAVFDVPFTTMSTNLIQGGTALNIIPAECQFTYEFRNVPSLASDVIQKRVQSYVEDILLPKMKKEYSGAEIKIENKAAVPSLRSCDEADPFIKMIKALDNGYEKRGVAFASEGGQYDQIGIPAIICGPGSIDVAHQPDEYVPCKDLEESEKFILKIVEKNQSLSPSI